jgi:hypothetical protein
MPKTQHHLIPGGREITRYIVQKEEEKWRETEQRKSETVQYQKEGKEDGLS